MWEPIASSITNGNRMLTESGRRITLSKVSIILDVPTNDVQLILSKGRGTVPKVIKYDSFEDAAEAAKIILAIAGV